jgi:predicted transcriptional regulator of viral defense system
MLSELSSARTLSRREAEVVGWLEAERRRSLTAAELRATLGWSDSVTWHVLSRLARKGWLCRTARGRYETVLAETGGWNVPNPWAALSAWEQRYYIGFKSAAYEHRLISDRPGSVQTCVAVGARKPLAWGGIPIVLIFLPSFQDEGVQVEKLHSFEVRIASVEKTLVDAGALPGRIGGLPGLARVVDRASDRADWEKVVKLGTTASRGKAGLRRIAALLELLGHAVPPALAEAATVGPHASPLFLGERRVFGAHGKRLPKWRVVVNVDPSLVNEEVSR